MKKKIAAIVTCFVMAMAFMPTFAFAADAQVDIPPKAATPLHYVSLGDADAAGFGMDIGAGYGVVTPGTYPALVEEALEQKGFRVSVDQMAMEGMRIEDLRYLLDNSYSGDAYQKDTFKDLGALRPDYQAAVEDADLITCRLGSVDFGSYLLYLAKDVDKNCSDPQIKALVETDADGIVPEYQQVLQDVVDNIPSAVKNTAKTMGYDIDALMADFSKEYIDAAAYLYYSACYNYDKSIQLIRAKNPDATIVVLGLDNMLDDLAVKVKVATSSFSVDIGNLYDQHVIQKVNAHLAAMQGINDDVDCSTMERFLGESKNFDGNVDSITPQFKDYCDVYEDDLQLAKDKDAKLGKYNKTKQEWGMKGAYLTAAASMQSVASLSTLEINYTTLMGLKDDPQAVTNMAKTLMKGMRDECWNNATKAAKDSSVAYIKSTVDNFVKDRLYGAKSDQELGRIVMAIGIRSQMGDGFFQHPSSKGHKAMSDAIMNACQDSYLYSPDQAQTCLLDGVQAYWQNLYTGTCYSDAAHTQVVQLADRRQPAPGHDWQDPVVVKDADVGVTGESKQKCKNCEAEELIVIPAKNPAGAKISKVTGAKKALTVKWTKSKDASKITGYELRYSLKSRMAGAKTVKASKSSVSKKITKLQAKKKYYVQIRAYKKGADGTMYYSGWSGKKSAKTKK